LGILVRVLGSLGLLLLVGFLLLPVWGLARIASFDESEEPGLLERKAAALAGMQAALVPAERPNVVLIFFDDLGYGDIGAFGSDALETPRMDALAVEGLALDHFYSASPVCSPSRAGLLTGRWPMRSGIDAAVFPEGSVMHTVRRVRGLRSRLPADEITLPEALRVAGYRTGMVGKWHLGGASPSLPHELGFDSHFGMLFSNDMDPVPIVRDGEVVDPHPVDQTTLTARYTEEAIRFLEAQGDAPFFLYMAHNFPHIPLFTSDEQRGRSGAGLYGDVIADLDRNVGVILDALDRGGHAHDTLVVLTSDNGPWFQGSPGGVRGRKGGIFEGGMRVPFLARWPGRIEAGTRSDVPATLVDLLPTLLALAGVPLPADRVTDGVDLAPLLLRGEAPAPRPILYYAGGTLWALREGPFKAHRRHGVELMPMPQATLRPTLAKGPWLFDLSRDPDESYDLSMRHPERLAQLLARMDALDEETRRNPRGWR
jgi:arylsulfatase A-like enzyme